MDGYDLVINYNTPVGTWNVPSEEEFTFSREDLWKLVEKLKNRQPIKVKMECFEYYESDYILQDFTHEKFEPFSVRAFLTAEEKWGVEMRFTFNSQEVH